MILKETSAQDYRVNENFKSIAANYTLKPTDQVVTVTAACTVTLPPVCMAKGKWYSIYSTVSGNVVLQDQDDSLDWADKTMTADTGRALLFSDGIRWWVVQFSAT